MIINVPVYLEIDDRFSPDQGRELAILCRSLLNDFIRKESGGFFYLNNEKHRYTVKVLSERQAIDRFGKKTTKFMPESQNPVDDKFAAKSVRLGTDFNLSGK